MIIRCNKFPAVNRSDASNAGIILYCLQLFFAAQIIANIMEKYLPVLFALRIFYQQGNGNGGAAATAKNIIFFLAPRLTLSASITPQMKYINAGKFFCQTLAQTACRVCFHKTRIGNKANNATLAYAVTGPTDGPNRAVPALCNADIAVSLTGCEGVGSGRGDDFEQDGLFLEMYEFLLSMLDDDIFMV